MEVTMEPYEETSREAIVVSRTFSERVEFPMHSHDRGQFIYILEGTVNVITKNDSWLAPTRYAIWVPSGMEHEMHMCDQVTILNIYISPEAASRLKLPGISRALEISPLLQSLLLEAAGIDSDYDLQRRDGRLMALLLDEISLMPELPLRVSLPKDRRIYRACSHMVTHPSADFSIDDAARIAGVSRKTFTRIFRMNLGVSFTQWRRQICMLAALGRLRQAEPITRIALDLGYSSPSAFTVSFRNTFGVSPTTFSSIWSDISIAP